MSLPVVLRDEAEAEFDDTFDWYDAQRVGLRTEFVTAVEAVFPSYCGQSFDARSRFRGYTKSGGPTIPLLCVLPPPSESRRDHRGIPQQS